MGITTEQRERCLEQARELVQSLETDDQNEADRLLESLAAIRETDLFMEIGKLTRQLHETLNGFRLDSRISTLAENEIPDAKERLNYVVTMTEQAANRTMDSVEESLPLAEAIGTRARDFKESWRRFRERDMSAEEFRELSKELDEFFDQTGNDIEKVRSNLSDVLMAQDFQDLTGQVIRRVTNLVQEVEESLVGMVRIAGQRLVEEAQLSGKDKGDGEDKKAELMKGQGPSVPGVDTADVVQNQDEVDDLLSSLGF